MTFTEKILATEAYKSLNSVQKIITMKRQNRLVIENGYNVAKTIGLDVWEKQHSFNYINKMIVRELIEGLIKERRQFFIERKISFKEIDINGNVCFEIDMDSIKKQDMDLFLKMLK